MLKQYEDIEECPLADVQRIIHGKWSMVIISVLMDGTFRFSELKRRLPNLTEANLTKELRLLEQYQIVHREVYREVPPKVEYSLTDIGKQFEPVLEELEKWGIAYQEMVKGKCIFDYKKF